MPKKVKQTKKEVEQVSVVGWQAWLVLGFVVVAGAAVYFFLQHSASAVKGDSGVTPLGIQASQLDKNKNYTPVNGSYAPPFQLAAVDGSIVNLASTEGRNKMIVFMTTDCVYCLQEIEHNNEIYKSGKVDFIMIDTSESADVVAQYIKNNNVEFPIYLDSNGNVTEWYAIQGTPTHFFVDEENKIFDRKIGLAKPAQIDDYISRLIAH